MSMSPLSDVRLPVLENWFPLVLSLAPAPGLAGSVLRVDQRLAVARYRGRSDPQRSSIRIAVDQRALLLVGEA